MTWLMSPGRACRLLSRVSSLVSSRAILFSMSSPRSFRSDTMSYMMFWVWNRARETLSAVLFSSRCPSSHKRAQNKTRGMFNIKCMHGRRYSDIILQRRENRSGLIPHHILLRQTLNNRQESLVQTEMSIPIVNHLAGKQLKDWCTFFFSRSPQNKTNRLTCILKTLITNVRDPPGCKRGSFSKAIITEVAGSTVLTLCENTIFLICFLTL